ncbi:ankyrin repeat domain-containing protein 35 [Mycteria americana]|uniref:ankyrin repeat domain-containing protein 35 n=1 Tax=Mycteria americana TaxID=33587 RepID=UPI003F587ACC
MLRPHCCQPGWSCPDAGPDAGCNPSPDAGPDAGSNPGPNPSPDAGCNPNPSPNASSDAGCNPSPDAGSDAGCNPSPAPSPDAGSNPNPSSNPSPGAGCNPNPNPGPDASCDPSPNPSPDAGSNPNPSLNPGPNPSPNPSSGSALSPRARPQSLPPQTWPRRGSRCPAWPPVPALGPGAHPRPAPRRSPARRSGSPTNQPGRRRQGHARLPRLAFPGRRPGPGSLGTGGPQRPVPHGAPRQVGKLRHGSALLRREALGGPDPKEGSAPKRCRGPSAWRTRASVSPRRPAGQGGGPVPAAPPEPLATPQVESWNKQDQKLLEAVEKGDVGRVSALACRKTARPTKLNAVGQSAFHLAASKGLTECLTLLLAHGAPVNEKNDDGSTALHLATIACQPQCVKVLLQYGANESHVDGQNRTPLHWAASSGCASSVLLLCDHEALLDVPDARGQTPLMLAARGNQAAICAQLLQRGADPNLADKDGKTALMLACEHRSLESAELLLSHGAAVGDEDRWRCMGQSPSRALRRLLRGARGKGRENGTGCAGDPASQVGSQGEGTPGSESEEEEEEDEEQQDGCDARLVRRLQKRLARKAQECQRLAAAADSIRQRVRELARLPPGYEAGDGAEDEDGACLALLAQHVEELRKRMMVEEEGDGGHPAVAQLDRDDEAPAPAPFLTWLGDECAKMRAAKASAFARSKGLRKEVEEALRSKLHYEVVSADAVRKSLAAWEKMVVGLEQTLSRADETHAKMLEGSRVLLENLRREPARPLTGSVPCRCPVNGTEPAAGGKSRAEPPKEGGSSEKEMLELQENNRVLLAELARLGRERERLQEELRGLRERDPGAEPAAEGPGAAALAQALAAEREEAARLRRKLAGQRRELAALRDGVGERAREAAGDAGAGILRELHRKLDGLVRSQHEALQLVAAMEGDGARRDGDGAGLLGELEDALGELVEELGPGPGPRVPRLLERLAGAAAALRGRELPGERPGAEAERWRAAAAAERQAKEAAAARAAEREREAQELREKAEGLERSLGSLRARAGERARACRDKEGKMKKLLAETEKLSAEVLRLRSQNARLQLQLEVQQKNHRDVVAVYRTHLLNAAQGFMDEGVHAMLLRILRTEE